MLTSPPPFPKEREPDPANASCFLQTVDYAQFFPVLFSEKSAPLIVHSKGEGACILMMQTSFQLAGLDVPFIRRSLYKYK
jgi:hypothetical protein